MEGNQHAVFKVQRPVMSICVTKDGKIVDSGSWEQTVHVWDIEGNQHAVFKVQRPVTSVFVTQDGKIISGSDDETVRVWDMEGNQLAVCRGHKGVVKSVCVTKDGKIVSGSLDGTVRVWDISLLDSIMCMNEDQARSLWVYVRKLPSIFDKQTCWREIEQILGEGFPVAPTNINNNNNLK